MSRFVNISGGITFTASTFKTFAFFLFSAALCGYCFYTLSQMGPFEIMPEARVKRALTGLFYITFMFAILNLLILAKDDLVSVTMTDKSMTYRFLFLRYEWKWDDIDQLHLDAPEAQSSLNALVWLMNIIISKLIPFGKTHILFEDLAFNEKRSRRWFLRPKKHGFVSLPLGYFSDINEMFKQADIYHMAWHSGSRPKA